MRVLISGYYGYGNLGDEAVLAGLAAGLRERGADLCVLSGNPAATRTMHDLRAVDRYRGLVSGLVSSDALVSGGGGLLQDVTSTRSLAYYLGVIRLARRLGKRTCVYAQSAGPLSEAGARRVARALSGVPIAVRDSASVALLGGLGLSASLVGDPALLLSARPAKPTAADAGASADAEASAAPVLLIPRAGHDDLNTALLEAGRRLRERGVPLALLALHERQDAAAVAKLAVALGLAPWRADSPGEALAHVASARYVLSVRLHGLIFAAIRGVGFAGLVYDPKVAGFLADARAPAFTRPVDADGLAAVAMAAAPPDARAVATLTDRARDGLTWLVQHIVR